MPDSGNASSQSASQMRSMTGYASINTSYEAWQVTGEIRSVNGRGLDLRMRIPDWIEGLEPALRKTVQNALGRGSVTVSIKVQRSVEAGGSRVNDAALDSALSIVEQIANAAEARGLALAAPSATDIAAFRGVVEMGEDLTGETGPLRAAILASFKTSLAEFDADRAREGAALAEVLDKQIDDIERLVAEARSALGDRAVAAKEAMARALARVMDATDKLDESRVEQELAMNAVKSDVAEELDRLVTHITAARKLLATTGPVGRQLDFLMQEFNREANTLCSKAQSSGLTAVGLEMKAVIDRMREQVQNVE